MVEQQNEMEKQVAALEQQLPAPYERADVHAAVGEQIKQVLPSYQSAAPSAGGGDVPSYQDPALASTVQDLVNVAFTQSLQEAIAKAVDSKNPALIDALHDVLADQLHQELLNRKKIEPAP